MANCPIYWFLLENVVRCAPSFNAERKQIKKSRSNPKPMQKNRTIDEERTKKKHLPKQNTKNLIDEKY